MEETNNEELIETKRQNLRKTMEKLKDRASGMMSYTSQLKGLQKHFDSVEANIEKRARELDFKEKELQFLSLELDNKSNTFEAEKSEAGDLKKSVEECTEEPRSKRNQLIARLDSLARSQSELDLRNKKLEEVESELRKLRNQVQKVKDRNREMTEESGFELLLDKIRESDKRLEQLQSRQNQLEIRSLELVSTENKLGSLRESIELSNSDLKLKEKLVQSLNNRVTVCNEAIDSRSEELRKIQKLIEQQTNELAILYKQGDSTKQLIQELSEKLIAKEKELECVAKSSKRLELDHKVKEKRVQALNNLITISSEQLELKSKELGEIQRELELKKQLRQMSNVLVKREKQPATASTIDTSQQNAAETEPINDDALLDYEFSATLTRHEVSNVLRAISNPAAFILEEVQEHIREELGSQDSVLVIFVLFFEELAKIYRSDNPQLQDKATQVPTIWKGNISIEAPKSSLEALAFLLFIVAYGLKKLINEEETALLASSIAHYEQAPRIFYAFSLSSKIQEFVKELIKKSQYIPAVRLICVFKLNEDEEFSPSHLIAKEIMNLRRSAPEMGLTESSQAKDKDAGKLRAILELVADYEINLPGYLIAKLIIQRENNLL